MPSIVTITLSPCIDKSTSVPELLAEKKLKCAAPSLSRAAVALMLREL